MENPKTDPNAAAAPIKYIEFPEHNGLTKRELIAKDLLCALLSNPKVYSPLDAFSYMKGHDPERFDFARLAVIHAGHLVDELNKPRTDEPAA